MGAGAHGVAATVAADDVVRVLGADVADVTDPAVTVAGGARSTSGRWCSPFSSTRDRREVACRWCCCPAPG